MLHLQFLSKMSRLCRSSASNRVYLSNRRSYHQASPSTPLWPPKTDTEIYKKLKYLVEQSVDDYSLPGAVNGKKGPLIGGRSSFGWKNRIPKRGSPPETVVEAFEESWEQNMAVPPFLMNVLIGSYGKLELGHRVLDLVMQETQKGTFRPHKRHLTNLMGALGRSGDLEAALAIYHLMNISNADCVTLISIIDILSRSYHAELAFQLWNSWRLSNTSSPILNVYTTLAEAAIKAHRFDLFQAAEMDAREQYSKAKTAKKLSRIANTQYTPKHCIFVSTLLHHIWVPTLRPIIPSNMLDTTNNTLTKWMTIRPALPGTPLTPSEILQWESDVDIWFDVNQHYGPSLDVEPSVLGIDRDPELYHDDSAWFTEIQGDEDAALDATMLLNKRHPSL